MEPINAPGQELNPTPTNAAPTGHTTAMNVCDLLSHSLRVSKRAKS
jgi:hypothetical protein